MSSINTRYTSPADMTTPRRVHDPRKTAPKGDNPLSPANPSTLRPTPLGKNKPHPDGVTPNPHPIPGLSKSQRFTAGASKAAHPDQPGGVTPNPHPIPGLGSSAAGAGAQGLTGLNDQPGGVTPNPHPIPGLGSSSAGAGAQGLTEHGDQPSGVTPNPHPIPGLENGRADPTGKDARRAEKTIPGSKPLTAAGGDDQARAAAEGLVSATFIEPILKQIREGNDAPPPFGPSSAEKQFGALLDTRLADEIAHATNFPIVQRIAEQLSRAQHATAPASRIDLDA